MQLKALANQAIQNYEDNANEHREKAPRYVEGHKVWIDTRNMKTNRPMKKGDNKWDGPHTVLKAYKRSCLLRLPATMKIFPVFHNVLLRPYTLSKGLPGQAQINEAESRKMRGRVLERTNGIKEQEAKWEFEAILDCWRHPKEGLQYQVKWKHHKPSWQPAADLKGNNRIILNFHAANPNKPGPPTWVKKPSNPW
jgi:hypothetical protein